MSTQSIHRATRTMPNPVRFAFFDYAAETFSPVTGRQWRFHYGPETLSAASHSDRGALRPSRFPAEVHLATLRPERGSIKVRSTNSDCRGLCIPPFSKSDRRLGNERRSPNSICRVPLLPSLQIGSRLMSRVAASAPIQPLRHWLRGLLKRKKRG